MRLMARMRRSVGLECVQGRVDISNQALRKVEDAAGGESPPPANGHANGNGAADGAADGAAGTNGHAGATSLLRTPSTPFAGVEFEHGDATKMGRLPYTHVYIYDWVFSKHTLREIAPVLQASPFYILISTRKVAEWWSYGLVKIQPVGKIPGFHNSGHESMTAYIYINLEKLPGANA